jgi:hypothetical protein
MQKENKKEWKQVNVSEKTEQQIHYTAMILGKTISGFLGELFDSIIQQSCNFKNDDRANLTYLCEYDDITLRFSGSKVACVGKCSNEQELTNIATDKIISDLTKKSRGLDL